MRFHRYGHLEGIKLKVGDLVSGGQLIAKNGTGNGQWLAHCHYDILTYRPAKWTEYCIGKSKEWVIAHYADPRGEEKKIMPTFDHLGLGWLEYWDYDSQSKKTIGAKSPCFHPGIDLNGKGSGNADLDDPIYSRCYGRVVYVYSGTDKNDGWGDLVVIEEIALAPVPPEEKPNLPEEPKQDEVVPIPVTVETPPVPAEEVPAAPDYHDHMDPKNQLLQLVGDLLNLIINLISKLWKK